MSNRGCKRGTQSMGKGSGLEKHRQRAYQCRAISGGEAMTRVQHGERMDGMDRSWWWHGNTVHDAKRNDMKVGTGLLVSLAWPYRTSQVRSRKEGKEPHPSPMEERADVLTAWMQSEEPAAIPRDGIPCHSGCNPLHLPIASSRLDTVPSPVRLP
ncbi:uncharacterized protein LY79DRAFT_87529 [Colletotrichum navitas]|uniref:Uncharacterized protein n=1 Tax=Colletotrichum navitas TaxID=681940 RepID=A0AAD8PL38_9PEZI|nr:uncharacterized protein LY79DRAFT_87529 [Colletotrichum navitas]KAK1569392.1 hypothetical protein LY79DRAFT_87529 [Colletotrichum navitas]